MCYVNEYAHALTDRIASPAPQVRARLARG
jgi:hypothetical protein